MLSMLVFVNIIIFADSNYTCNKKARSAASRLVADF